MNTTECFFADNGNGGVLAHAFRPAKDNRTHPANRHTDPHYDKNDDLAGDLHFDMNENWIFHQPSEEEKNAGKKYIFTTAVHELGHSIGRGQPASTFLGAFLIQKSRVFNENRHKNAPKKELAG